MPELPAARVLLWRRVAGCSDAERYTAFYPVDTVPHIALLDPRTGERLLVWDRTDISTEAISDSDADAGADADADTDLNSEANADKDAVARAVDANCNNNDDDDLRLWEIVKRDIDDFAAQHALGTHDVGPVHAASKPWRVRTRRPEPTTVNGSTTCGVAAPHAAARTEDEEEAAIAAAIAASLRDVEEAVPAPASDAETEGDDEEYEDSDDDETSSRGSSTSQKTHMAVLGDDDGASIAHSTSLSVRAATVSSASSSASVFSLPASQTTETPCPLSSLPVPPPSSSKTAGAASELSSSVESVSSSYLERLASCLRASNNPELLETRRLRGAQDAALRASLDEDRAREQAERVKEIILKEARARLPQEPEVDNTRTIVHVALRLPDGRRLARRFAGSDRMQAVADFVIIVSDASFVPSPVVHAFLRAPGVDLASANWDSRLTDVGLVGRAAIFVQP